MFARFAALLSIAALATSVVAAPGYGGGDSQQCNGGAVKCCNQEFEGSTPFEFMSGKSLVTAVLSAVGNVGFQCSPVTIIGAASGAQCSSQTACCTGSQDGVINVQCTPINLDAA